MLRLFFLAFAWASTVHAHGFITVPALRGGASPSSVNGYCPQCLGSVNLPMPVCGNDAFFKYSQGPLTTLQAGELFEVRITITAHHRGHFVLRLCDQPLGPDMSKDPEACLNENVLQRARPEEVHTDCKVDDPRGDCQPIDEFNPGYWYVPPRGWEDREVQVAGADWQDSMANKSEQMNTVIHPALEQNGSSEHQMAPQLALSQSGTDTAAQISYSFHYRLPASLTCDKCTLQWAWKTANSCSPHPDAYNCHFQNMERLGWRVSNWCSGACTYHGSCPNEQGPPKPCGEEFANCADVRIERTGEKPTASPTASDGGSTQLPTAAPTPTPEPEPEPEPPSTGKELVVFVENWKSCPSIDKIKQYTKVIISFAVSYTWSPQKNVCSSTCDIAPPAICANSQQPGLVQSWQAAGTKVLISVGGAGMGGSWAGDVNDCWEHCFDRVGHVVTQLTSIVNAYNFDGVDIDYEYFHSAKSTAFLRDLTLGLRSSLGVDKIVSHAPMDGDVAKGKPYYELMKEVATSVDYILPQYYNGPHRPAQSLDGPLQHMGDLIDDVFAGDQRKVLFGFCISDCSGTGSNVGSSDAVSIISQLKVSYPHFGGVFLWAASNDVGWSRPVAEALGGSSATSTMPPSMPPQTTSTTTATSESASTQAPTTTATTSVELTSPPPSGQQCIRDDDCSRNQWCNAPGYEEWCKAHDATCPAPYCRRASSTETTASPTAECVRDADCSRNPWCSAPGYETWCADHKATCPSPYCVRATSTETTAAPSGERCVRDADCSRNPWCNAPGYEAWCENHKATCPAPYCMRTSLIETASSSSTEVKNIAAERKRAPSGKRRGFLAPSLLQRIRAWKQIRVTLPPEEL